MMDSNSTKMDLNHLAYYVQRVRTFVESNKKSLSFPRISSKLEDVLVKITTEDPEFLKSSQFSKNVNLEAEKLISTLNLHVDIKLKHKFEDGKHGPNTLVYTKMEGITCKPLEPLRKPCIAKTTTMQIPLTDSNVTPVFKTSCLNVTTAFVKDDRQLIMKYPEMAKAQADFIMNMLLPGIRGKMEKADVGFGYRSMYAPLWESMKLFSLKYDFKIHHVDLMDNSSKLCVVFEKIPKNKPPEEMDVDMPPKRCVLEKVQNTKPPENVDVDMSIKRSSSSTVVIPTAPSLSDSADNQSTKLSSKQKKLKKLIGKLELPIRKKKLTEQFLEVSLRRVLNFLLVESEASIVFEQMNDHQVYFLQNVDRLSQNRMALMLFTEQSQKLLGEIKHCQVTKKVQYKTSFIKSSKTVTKKSMLIDIKFEKIANFSKVKVVKPTPELKNMTAYFAKYMQVLNEKNEQEFKNTVHKEKNEHEINAPVQEKENERAINCSMQEKKNEPTNKLVQKENERAINKPEQEIKNKTINKLVQKENERDINKLVQERKNEPINKSVKKKNTNDDVQESQCPIKPLTKDQQERLIRLKAIRDNVVRTSGEKCIHQIIKKISSFITTTSENSTDILTYEKMTDHQAAFIKNVQIFADNVETYPLFSNECRSLLADIKLNVMNCALKIESIDDKIGSHTYTTIRIKKEPANTKKQEVAKRARSLSAGRRGKKAERKAGKTSRGKSSGRISRSHAKLIEGLAQPVQSDKAMRIMQSMGWTGGALGLRATGIIEPIRPAIDKVTRAGFGHVPPPPKPVKTKARVTKPVIPKDNTPVSTTMVPETDFLPFGVLPVNCLLPNLIPPGILPTGVPNMLVKTIQLNHPYGSTVLDAILELVLNKSIGTVEFVYSTYIQRKPRKLVPFIVQAVTCFNERKLSDVWSSQHQRQIATSIFAVSQSCPDVQLTTELYDNNCLVHKCPGASTNNNDNTENNNVAATDNITNEDVTKDIPCIDLTGPFMKLTYKKVRTNGHLDDITTNPKGVPKNKKKDKVNQNDGVGDLSCLNKNNTEINYDFFMETDGIVLKNDLNEHRNVKSDKTDDKTDQTDRNDCENTDTANYIILIDECIETDFTANNITVKSETFEESNKNRLEIQINTNDTDSNDSMIVANKIGEFLQADAITTNNIVESEIISETDKTQIETVLANSTINKVERKIDVSNNTQVDIITTNKIDDDVEIIDTSDNYLNEIVKTNSVNNIDTGIAEKIDNSQVEIVETNNVANNNSEISEPSRIQVQAITTTNTMVIHSVTRGLGDLDKTQTDIVITNTNDVKTEKETIEADDIEICNIMSSIKIENQPSNKPDFSKTTNIKTSPLNHYNDECITLMNDNPAPTIDIDSEEENSLLISDKESETIKANKKACKITKRRKSLDSLEFQDAIDALENLADDITKAHKTEKDVTLAPQEIIHGKRPSVESPDIKRTVKKYKRLDDHKKLCIVPKDNKFRIDNEKARDIQSAILEAIDYTKDLPLLKCQGIQNGGLIYSCHDEKSLFFMEDLIKRFDDLRIVYEFDVKEKVSHKMAFKINSFVDENVDNVLIRLDLYNKGLCSSKWRVIKKEQHNDFIVIYVEVDNASFVFIRNANFSLYAGNDCVNFSFVWD